MTVGLNPITEPNPICSFGIWYKIFHIASKITIIFILLKKKKRFLGHFDKTGLAEIFQSTNLILSTPLLLLKVLLNNVYFTFDVKYFTFLIRKL